MIYDGHARIHGRCFFRANQKCSYFRTRSIATDNQVSSLDGAIFKCRYCGRSGRGDRDEVFPELSPDVSLPLSRSSCRPFEYRYIDVSARGQEGPQFLPGNTHHPWHGYSGHDIPCSPIDMRYRHVGRPIICGIDQRLRESRLQSLRKHSHQEVLAPMQQHA